MVYVWLAVALLSTLPTIHTTQSNLLLVPLIHHLPILLFRQLQHVLFRQVRLRVPVRGLDGMLRHLVWRGFCVLVEGGAVLLVGLRIGGGVVEVGVGFGRVGGDGVGVGVVVEGAFFRVIVVEVWKRWLIVSILLALIC